MKPSRPLRKKPNKTSKKLNWLKKITSFLKKVEQKLPMRVIFLGAIIALILILALKSPSDPDMGWHLRNGQLFLETKKLFATDPYSYTMSDFPLIAHSWATDIIIFKLNQWGKFWLLAIFFSLITGLAFFIATSSVKAKTEYKLIAVLLGVMASLPILGVRSQMITLLFLGVLLNILFEYSENPQTGKIFFLPFIFFFWTNLHGGFFIGMTTLIIFGGIEFFRIIGQKIFKSISVHSNLLFQRWLVLLYVFFFCLFATFVNPYGYRIYEEVFHTIFNPLQMSFISEWFPITFNNPMASQFTIYLVLLGILLIFYWRRLPFAYLGLVIIFIFITFPHWRNMPLLVMISLPFLVKIVEELTKDSLAEFTRKGWVVLILLILLGYHIQKMVNNILPEIKSEKLMAINNGYPYYATSWLKEHPQTGKIYNEYNWGGYLIWQDPQIKVFIDGRMPPWKLPGRDILDDFRKISNLQDGWEEVLKKYNPDYALIYSNSKLKPVLLSQQWKIIYSDNLATIVHK
jgi:hypothetical protein